MTLHLSIGERTRATISARKCVDAGADDTRVELNKFQVLLCLPTALVLLLIQNGDFGTSSIYGHHRARYCLPLWTYMGWRTQSTIANEGKD